VFSTFRDDQRTVQVSIFEGERAMCADNNQLGNFFLEGVPLNKAGVPKIEVTFEIDVNGVLHVSATEESTGAQNHVSIKSEKGRLSKERIAELVAEAEANQEADKRRTAQADSKMALERFLLQLRQMMVSAEVVEKVPLQQRNQIDAMISQNLDWLSSEGNLATKEQLDGQKKQIEDALAPVLGRLYQSTGVVPGQADGKLVADAEAISGGSGGAGGSGASITAAAAVAPPSFAPGAIAPLGPPYGAAVAPPAFGTMPLPPAVATNVASIGKSIIYQ
jgi:hypothetical protein